MSLAVTVRLPAVFNVTVNVFVPFTSAAFGGSTALVSEEVIPTVSVTVFARLLPASTALTVTVKAVPAVCGVGVPLLPVAVPGAKVSPGASTSSPLKAPPLIVKLLLTALVKPGELAVSCLVPAVSISRFV